MVVLDSQWEKLRNIKWLEMTWEVKAPWSSTHKQHTSTYYTISLEIYSDSTDLKIKLKSTWEIVLARLELPSPINTPADLQ